MSPVELSRGWGLINSKPESGPSSSLSLSPSGAERGKLKVMPRMKDRRPSEQIKRTATIDRKPSITKVGEFIDLTMDSDDEEEDEEERERRNVRPLLHFRAGRNRHGRGESGEVEGVVEREQGRDGVEVEMGVGSGVDEVEEHDAGGDREEAGRDAEEKDAWGDGGEADHDQAETPVDDPSADCAMDFELDGPEAEGVEDDNMAEDPNPLAEEPTPAREPTLEPELAPELDLTHAMEYPDDMDSGLPAIATVDEPADQADSEAETLDGDDGDAQMWNDNIEDEEVDELAGEEGDLDGAREADWTDLHLDLLFGTEASLGADERYCRLCL